MTIARVVGLALLAASALAFAQYPSRGNPDPSWNGGRPRVFTAASVDGLDRAVSISTLSGTRFAAIGYRPYDTRDYVAIVDTVPERVIAFDSQFASNSNWELLQSLAVVDASVVVGGAVNRSDNKIVAAVQVLETGVGATPVNLNRGVLLSESPNASRPDFLTTTVTAQAGPAGLIRVWQARSEINLGAAMQCGASTLFRLDHQAGAFVERGHVDLATTLGQTCLVAYYSLLDTRRASDPPGSQAIVIGASCRLVAGDVAYVCLTRVLDTGGPLTVDRSFGANGLFTYGAATRQNWVINDLRADAAGRFIVPMDRETGDPPRQKLAPGIIRTKPDGTIDNAFGTSGLVDIPVGLDGHVGHVAITPSGVVQAVGSGKGSTGTRPYVFYYDPATALGNVVRLEFIAGEPNYTSAAFESVVALPAGGALAVGGVQTDSDTGRTLIARLAGDRQTIDLLEYYHSAFNHFFVASVPAEIQKLDDGTFAGWQRTGHGFAALPVGAAGASDACRFFSATFAPRSSHFYTSLQSECEGLKSGNVWTYEGLVFALQSPSAAGVCPPGTNPLFRLYNDGEGGAPNHRLTTSETARAAQAGQGWVGEGSGSPPVFACVPA